MTFRFSTIHRPISKSRCWIHKSKTLCLFNRRHSNTIRSVRLTTLTFNSFISPLLLSHTWVTHSLTIKLLTSSNFIKAFRCLIGVRSPSTLIHFQRYSELRSVNSLKRITSTLMVKSITKSLIEKFVRINQWYRMSQLKKINSFSELTIHEVQLRSFIEKGFIRWISLQSQLVWFLFDSQNPKCLTSFSSLKVRVTLVDRVTIATVTLRV